MDFGLQSPFAHHLDPGDFQEELSSAVVTHNDEKIPMPQFYHNQQRECVNELEWETKSIHNLNNTAPVQVEPYLEQYMKMRSLPQSEQNSSQVEIFNPGPLDQEFASSHNYLKRVLHKNASSQFGKTDDQRGQKSSSIHQSSRRAKYYSEPQSQQNTPSHQHEKKDNEQEQQDKQLERKREDFLKRLAQINDFSVETQENDKQEETASQTKEAQNSTNIDTTSVSFADIVKAIERVKFVPPTVRSIQQEEQGGGSFQTGQDIQRRPDDWSPASYTGNSTLFTKPKRAKQKSKMTALDKLNFDGEEIKFD